MRALRIVVLAAAVLAACATPQSRIKKHQAQFDAYPPEVQQKIRDGQVEPGFTFDQVELALGAPDRTFNESQPGREREIWSYGGGCAEPRLGFGFGFGSWHRGGSVGTGVSVGTGGGAYACEDRIRVTFEGGRLVDVRRRTR